MEHYLTYLRELNMASMMLRIFLAMLMGGLIGIDIKPIASRRHR